MESKYKFEDIRKIASGRKARPIGKFRYSSVLLPLLEIDGGLHILFEVRAHSLKAQPGEISFPGGGVEDGEGRAAAAVRETSEELGIPAEKIEVIAELDYISSHDGSNIFCMLGTFSEQTLADAVPNRDEVEEIFLVPLKFFLETEPDVYTNKVVMEVDENFPYGQVGIDENYRWRRSLHTVFVYDYEDPSSRKRYVIWGLTAMMVRNFVMMLEGEDLSGMLFG
ncbi:MAG: CoA pyrophosphatase [Clostridiales Family XIII bacterium]|jgi:8-oxo-dGTP pyrophosphatase MutT (NUDIX family)|nr:CoA pyrophosphatase [Clostridiales Family XIII bacterium]